MKTIHLSRNAAVRIAERGTIPAEREQESFRRFPEQRIGGGDRGCLLTNDGASVIRAGDLVGIHSMTDSDLDPEEAVQNWINEGIRANAKLIGDIDDASAGRLIRAAALEDIEPGATGRGEAPGAFMARIWRDPNEFKTTERCTSRAEWRTVTIGGTEMRRLACVRYPGEYILIDAAGPGEDDFLFGLLTPSLPGHLISGIISADPESKRVTLSNGLTASFPMGKITADLVGKKAAVSRGTVNRDWEILATADDD